MGDTVIKRVLQKVSGDIIRINADDFDPAQHEELPDAPPPEPVPQPAQTEPAAVEPVAPESEHAAEASEPAAAPTRRRSRSGG